MQPDCICLVCYDIFILTNRQVANLPVASGGVPSAFEFQVTRARWNAKI